MKFKFTIGNVCGLLVSGAGFVMEHTQLISGLVPPKVGSFVIAAGAAILAFSHNVKPNAPVQ
jgi:hypothetical protein